MADYSARTGPVVERRIDIGAQVGIQRNRLFAAGGRTNRITPMAYRVWRPLLDSAGLVLLAAPVEPTASTA